MSCLCIELGSDSFLLKFQLLDSPITKLWVERMHARDSYRLDHPDRFYGFNSQEDEIFRAEKYIKDCIHTINQYQQIINREFTSVHDQDCLNYLHNIFEEYHGLLDEQNSIFWKNAPDKVRRALADLNLAVHRCENVSRGNYPRFVCTWYGMPKELHLPEDIMLQYSSMSTQFGTVYLNYAEIGKTLEDLTMDQDQYIGDDAFKPFDFYTADFNVRFWDNTPEEIQERVTRMEQYYNKHQDFFVKHGYTTFNNPKLLPLRFPLAQLIETMPRKQLLEEITQRQYVSQVYIK